MDGTSKNPDPQIEGFEWTDDMREISGFGGGYERTCRRMVSQGAKWWSEHPDANPVFKGFKQVFGIAVADNNDAKALDKAMVAGIPHDESPTGAMHQAAMNHIFAWRRFGSWLAYQAEMRRLRREEGEDDGA